jgi:glycine cleavage system aminomethyltransferase T
MVDFAGYALPVNYPDGWRKSHMHTRAPGCASLFDVGHMGQLKWTGPGAAAFLETLCVADVAGLKPGAASLTLITNDNGGIIDDSIITNHGSYLCVRRAAKQARQRAGWWDPPAADSRPPPPPPAARRPPPRPRRPPPPQLHGRQRRHQARRHGAL